MAIVPAKSRWASQPTSPAAAASDFAWNLLVNQAFPQFNAASSNRLTARGSAAVGRGGRFQSWHGVNALESVNAPLPTTATGYTALWVGPINVANTGTPFPIIRTTGGGFRLEAFSTPGGAYVSATHTGVVGLNGPFPSGVSWDFRSDPWTVLLSYDGITATLEVVTPTREYGIASTVAGMSDGTGTIDLSVNPGVFGAYLVGYARRSMPAELRRRILANPWSVFERRQFLHRAASSGGIVLAGASASSATVAGVAALVQSHALAAAAAVSSSSSSTGALTQTHLLAAAGASSSTSATTGEVSQASGLLAAGASSGTAASGAALSQTHLLAGAGASSSTAASGAGVVTAGVLAGAPAVSATAASSGAAVQDHVLTAADAVASGLLSAAQLSQAHVLTAAPASSATQASGGALATGSAGLAGASASSATQASGAALSQTHMLAAAGATSATAASPGGLLGALSSGAVVRARAWFRDSSRAVVRFRQ